MDMQPEAWRYAEAIFEKAYPAIVKRSRAIESEMSTMWKKCDEELTQIRRERKWNGNMTWEDLEEWETVKAARFKKLEEESRPLEEERESVSTMLHEFRRIMVTFDEDGNPICNIDLAKYGLSMPIITPKPDRNYQGKYTVIFPHELETAQPTNATETIVDQSQPTNAPSTKVLDTSSDISSEQQEAPVKKSKPYWIGILVLAVIGGVIIVKIASRKKSK